MNATADDTDRPNYGELVAILTAGIGHVATETIQSAAAARWFNGVAAVVFLVYVVWRLQTADGISGVWGMRRTNLRSALTAQMAFGLPAIVALTAWGVYVGRFPPRPALFLGIVAYPVYGIAQQFALQNLLARNLRVAIHLPAVRAAVTAALFGLAHFPLLPLVLLTTVAGFFMTWIYDRHPNLWAVGCLHGVLGAFAFYFVLGREPGARLWEMLARSVYE